MVYIIDNIIIFVNRQNKNPLFQAGLY